MRYIVSICLCFFALLSEGNNVRIVGTVKTPQSGIEGDIVSVYFTLEWENSWRDSYNHDAVYVTLRYKFMNASPEIWYPLCISDEGNSADNGFVCDVAPGQTAGRNVGVFIYRSKAGTGISRTNVVLKWDLSTTGGKVQPGTVGMGQIILACTGIEMVYIPRGAFRLGDKAYTDGTQSSRTFYRPDVFIPRSWDLVDTCYYIETNPNNPVSPYLAANRVNDLTNSETNAWVGHPSESTLTWTIDFRKRPDGTETGWPGDPYGKGPTVRYLSIESIPGRVPAKWELWAANDNVSGSWGTEPIYTGTGSDWVTSLERVYPGTKAVKVTNPGNYRMYRIEVSRSDMPGGKSPVIKSVSMTEHDLSRDYDNTFLIDTSTTLLGGLRGLNGLDDGETWPSSETVLGSDYPNGYSAFYVMKYEMSQDQYCGFLNMIGARERENRTVGERLRSFSARDYVFGGDRKHASNRNGIVISTRNVTGDTVSFACDLDPETPVSLDGDGLPLACNYLTVSDMLAYASWVGLRPLTELEYERLCRAPYPYVPEPFECSWGTTVAQAPGSLSEGGKTNESVSSGNVNYGNRIGGPLRVGIFARTGGSQESSGSSFWGVQDLSGNLNEIYYNANAAGRKFKGTKHGNGDLAGLSTVNGWGWVTDAACFGLRGGSFRSGSPTDLSGSNRQYASRYITDIDARDSTVSFRLGRSCSAGPVLESELVLEDGRILGTGSMSDTVCSGSDYKILGNEPSGDYSVSYLWYKSENRGRSWDLLDGECGRDLQVYGLENRGMSAGEVRDYWYRRRVIRDNSDGLSGIVKLVVVDPDYRISRLRDTIDGYGKGGGITVTTQYTSRFTWRYLATGQELRATEESALRSYFLPRYKDFTEDTTHAVYGTKTIMVTINVGGACERSEVIALDVVNTMDKDLMKVKDFGSYRGWADGTYAPSAEGYRRPGGGYEYRGDIGSGVYRIDPDGRDGPIEPFDVYCDMVTEGGGWTLCMVVTNINGQYTDWWNRDCSFGGRPAADDYFVNTQCFGQYLKDSVKLNAKSPAFLYNAFSEMMVKENSTGQTGYKGFRLKSSNTMLDRFKRGNNTSYVSDVSAILFSEGTLNTFQTNTLMWNYDIYNDGARLATTSVYRESTCGISSRVDGGTGYSWKGNLTYFLSTRHYNTNGGIADHTVWIWIK